MPKPVKLIMLGESGGGKTTALASLLNAGYNVRVIDVDNGIDALRDIIQDPKGKYNQETIKNLSSRTLTEKMRVAQGRIVPANATVWQKAADMLIHWKFEDAEGNSVDLGKVNEWGAQEVLVVDTLGTLGTAALNFHQQMNGKLGSLPVGNSWRRDIGSAQGYIDNLFQLVFDESIKCNVILNTHIVYSKEDGSMPQEGEQNIPLFGFPSVIGKALGPKAGKYFNNMLLVKKEGPLRRIYTKTQGNISLKSAAPSKVKDWYSHETGLAEYFAAVRGE